MNRKIILKTNKKIAFYLISKFTGLPKNLICNYCISFPSSLPSNLDRNQIQAHSEKDFVFFEKSDGTRYILLCSVFSTTLINRLLMGFESAYEKINHPSSVENRIFQEGQVFDGELVFNKILDDYEFLIFDFMIFKNDWRISSWNYWWRIYLANILYQKKRLASRSWVLPYRLKKLYFNFNIERLFGEIDSNYISREKIYSSWDNFGNLFCNKNDGIVVSFANSCYTYNKSLVVYKWKFKDGNSVDLGLVKPMKRFKNYYKLTSQLNFYCNGKRAEQLIFEQINKPELNSNSKEKQFHQESTGVHEAIIDKISGTWCLLKKRNDKKYPNAFRSVLNVVSVLYSDLGTEEFLDLLKKHNIRRIRNKAEYSNKKTI